MTYSIALDRRAVVAPSAIGIIVDGQKLGERVDIGNVEAYAVEETYPWRGVHSTAVARCRGARVALTDVATRIGWSIDARACDDGVGFRYIVPGAAAATRVPDEATEFRLPPAAIVWSHDFEGHYEGLHERRQVATMPDGLWAAPPLTIQLPDAAGYASITESALANYAGMGLRADGRNGFAAKLGHEQPVSYPYRLRYRADDVTRLSKAAAIAGTITTPWRVVIVGRTLNALVNADIVHNLAPKPNPALFGDAASWIKPGRAVWRYLDGGDNTYEGLLRFNALAQQLGFEYHVVEGIWQRWSDAQLRAFVDDARRRGVGIWLWKSSQALLTPADQRAFFDQCRAVGAVGAKIDFFDHEAKEMIDRYQSILAEAAERRIMINFHGANKPTGESRSWPNELTREAVSGLERRSTPAWATHTTTLPFTRYLAGPADFTPVVFGDRRKETSWAHQIATAAVFTSPLLVYGAHPQTLLDNPAVEIIKAIPSVWDETIVLPPSEIGQLAAFARRSGTSWFVAVLNGPTARRIQVDLSFLAAGSFDVQAARDRLDGADNSGALIVDRGVVSNKETLSIDLRAAGGFVARLTPK